MMNFSILIQSTIIHLVCGFAYYSQLEGGDEVRLFESFAKKFEKNYTDHREYLFRFQVFKNTLERINQLNSQRTSNTDALYGITLYSDLTPEEFKIKMISNNPIQTFNRNSLENFKNQKSSTNRSKSKKRVDLSSSDGDLLNRIKLSEQKNLILQTISSSTRHILTDHSSIRFDSSNITVLSNFNRSRPYRKLPEFDRLIANYLSLHDQLNVSFPIIEFERLIESIASKPKNNKTSLADRPSKQLEANKRNVRSKRSYSTDYMNVYDELLPASYPRMRDWRESGVISRVDNQNMCGACWAHSTMETIESMAAIKYGWPVDKRLSVQQLIDCSTNNYGCLGGDTCAVLSWISVNKIKLLSAKDYPTRQSAGECHAKNDQIASGLTVLRNFTCTDYTNYEIELIKLLANHGPVATTADASLWQDYLGGIIQFNCGREANHAVQIVGYNLKTDIPYYIVRNTWGSNFGINGYLHVAIGNNLCSLEERVSALDVEII